MHVETDQEDADICARLLQRAEACLDASERLCADMIDGSWQSSFSRGTVCLWLGFHAVELFMKACICRLDRSKRLNTHSLGTLNLILEELDPALTLDVPFGPEPVAADYELMEIALENDRTMHEQLSYPIDRQGRAWDGVRGFSEHYFRDDLRKIRAEFERVRPMVFGGSF